jgi:hypothetical protein
MITLCNCWHRSWSWPNTQHIQKLATEDLWFLRYCRSRVFTFVFFMQQLKGISSGQNNKGCRIIHNGSNKIGFTFFWSFCDFARNLQESAKLLYYWSYLLRIRPWKDVHVCNVAPMAAGRRGLANSGKASGLGWAGAGRGGWRRV